MRFVKIHPGPFRQALCAAIPLLALAATVRAAEQDAARPNAQVGAVFGTIDSAGNANKSAQAELRFTAPLTRLLGASLAGSFADTNIQIDMPADLTGVISCGYETLGGRGTLFARRPSLGRVSASLLTSQMHSKCSGNASFVANDSDTLRSTGYSLAAEYYFPALTLAAERTSMSFDGDRHVTDFLTASWYPLPDLSLSPGVGRVGGNNQYELTVEHQPDFLGRASSIALTYGEQDRDGDAIRSFSIAITYHFGARVDLKTRDRQYR